MEGGRTGIFNNTPAPDREGIFNNTPAWNKIDAGGVPLGINHPSGGPIQGGVCGGISSRLLVAEGLSPGISPELTPHKSSHLGGTGDNGDGCSWKRGKLADIEIEELREEYERHQKENLNEGIISQYGGVGANAAMSSLSPSQRSFRSSNNDGGNAKTATSGGGGLLGSLIGGISRWIPGPSEPHRNSTCSKNESQPSRKRRRVQLNEGEEPETEEVSWINLADKTLGAKVIISSDDFFGPAKNLLNPKAPTFDPELYGHYGKIVDGWESRRRRHVGHNWCIIRLAAPTLIKRIEMSTKYFLHNFAPSVSLEGAKNVGPGELEEWLGSDYPKRMIDSNNTTDRTGQGHYIDDGSAFLKLIETKMHCDDNDEIWYDIVPATALQPGLESSHLHAYQPLDCGTNPITYLRLNQFPDGGIARLRVLGVVAPCIKPLASGDNYACLINGARIICYSSAHFSHPRNMLLPGEPVDMSSGWETARHRDRPTILKPRPVPTQDYCLIDWGDCEGEWVVVQLAQRCQIHMVTVSTEKFIGNVPETISVHAVDGVAFGLNENAGWLEQKMYFNEYHDSTQWVEILGASRLQPDTVHDYSLEDMSEADPVSATHIKISMMPDGGIARIGIFGMALLQNDSTRRKKLFRKLI